MARRSAEHFASVVDVPGRPIGEDEEAELFEPVETHLAAHHRLLLQSLQQTSETRHGRLMVFMPPGSAKSTYASVVFPSWYLGGAPERKVILASYGHALAKKMGRRTRSILRQQRYQRIFGTALSEDSSAADQFSLTNASEYMASGLLAGITGNRAHGILVDDPVSGIGDARSETMSESTWEAWQNDLLTRLIPGGWVVLIMCMTGDTRVRMADGSERHLRDISAGDQIATYDNGKLSTATVMHWANQGPNDVFEIRTALGFSTRANARHPFLIERRGVRRWIRLKNLKIGDMMVRFGGEPTAAPSASRKDASSRQSASRVAPRTTIGGGGKQDSGHRQTSTKSPGEPPASSIGTESPTRSIGLWSRLKVACARFAGNLRRETCALTGAASSASITITKRAGSEDFSATTATSRSDMGGLQKCSRQLPNTCDFTLDEIVAIEPAGREDVFDIQVERTENFIADGFVSHNTRWDMDDIAGRILPHGWNGDSGEFDCRDGMRWRVLCLQAKCETATDPLGRSPGEYLWTEWFDRAHWAQFEANEILWNSLYQQRPQPLGGAFFKEEQLLVRDDSNEAIPLERRVYKPVPTPKYVDAVFAVIDCAAKDNVEHDGLGVTYWAVSLHGTTPHKLYVLDWDYTQLSSDLLITWLPQVFDHLNDLAGECVARMGSLGAWIEDKAGGIVLLQQSERAGWLAQKGKPPSQFPRPGYIARAIDSKLTAAGKLARNVNASGPVSRGEVKFTERAFNKTVNFKGIVKNHQWDQVLGFRTGVKQTAVDDLDDTFCYGVAIALGNSEGF